MKENSYAEAFATLWHGTTQLAGCLADTAETAVIDSLRYTLRHYLVVLTIAGAFAAMTAATIQARTERDYYNRKAYYLEQSIDSLEILMDR